MNRKLLVLLVLLKKIISIIVSIVKKKIVSIIISIVKKEGNINM